MTNNNSPILDKNGVELEEFDIIKVYHFTGARRKKHYMYKMVVVWEGRLYGSHLNKNPLEANYPLWCGYCVEDNEIVQSNNWKKLK